jgi:hypothetical protein
MSALLKEHVAQLIAEECHRYQETFDANQESCMGAGEEIISVCRKEFIRRMEAEP